MSKMKPKDFKEFSDIYGNSSDDTEKLRLGRERAVRDSERRLGVPEKDLEKKFPEVYERDKNQQDEAYNKRSYFGKIVDKFFGKKNIGNNSKNETRSESELIQAEIERLEWDINNNDQDPKLRTLKQGMIKELTEKLKNSKETQT